MRFPRSGIDHLTICKLNVSLPPAVLTKDRETQPDVRHKHIVPVRVSLCAKDWWVFMASCIWQEVKISFQGNYEAIYQGLSNNHINLKSLQKHSGLAPFQKPYQMWWQISITRFMKKMWANMIFSFLYTLWKLMWSKVVWTVIFLHVTFLCVL